MKEKKSLFKNTIMLYILLFSGYFFSLLTIPYITRVLGPSYYGRIGFSQSLMNYVALFVDFGFILSATEAITKNRSNTKNMSKIVSEVFFGKLILSFISLVIVISFVIFSQKLRSDFLLILLTFFSTTIVSFLPDFFYRGIEKMEIITIRTVIIQLISTICVFIFVNSETDYILIPLFPLIGNLIAVILTYIDANKKHNVRLIKVSLKDIYSNIKSSGYFFISRIAGTIYSSTNLVILGFVYPMSSPLIGYYTASDKLVSTARRAFSPIADSLYPYMLNQKDFKFLKKVLLLFIPIMILLTSGLFVFSEEIYSLLFGQKFVQGVYIFKLMIPLIFLTPFSYILGFPTLSPLGLSKYANLSTVYAAIIQITLLVLSVIFNLFSLNLLCIISIISESFVVLFRLYVVIKYGKRGVDLN